MTKPPIRSLRLLETETLLSVRRSGNDPICADKCRMVGKQCPYGWCEATFQKIRKGHPPIMDWRAQVQPFLAGLATGLFLAAVLWVLYK